MIWRAVAAAAILETCISVAGPMPTPMPSAAPTHAKPVDWPVISKDRVLLRTNVGDIVVATYPKLAPGHAKAFAELARLGVYDGTPIFLVDTQLGMQIGGVGRRSKPLSPEQLAVLKRLKAEFSGQPHRYGTLTMARDPDNPDSAESSFLILLNEVPAMDGKFTVFGEVEIGHDVLEAIRRVTVDTRSAPVERIVIERAIVFEDEPAARAFGLQGAREDLVERMETLPLWWAAAVRWSGAAGVVLLALWWLTRRRALRALGLGCCLMSFFGFFTVIAPLAKLLPGMGPGLFVACLGMFQLMTRYER